MAKTYNQLILLHSTLQLLSCYTLGATVRTVRGEKCRKLPTCLEPKKDESRGVGSSLINLRSGAEPDINCQLPKRKVLSPLKSVKTEMTLWRHRFCQNTRKFFLKDFCLAFKMRSNQKTNLWCLFLVSYTTCLLWPLLSGQKFFKISC